MGWSTTGQTNQKLWKLSLQTTLFEIATALLCWGFINAKKKLSKVAQLLKGLLMLMCIKGFETQVHLTLWGTIQKSANSIHFQQDNVSKHTASTTRDWIDSHDFKGKTISDWSTKNLGFDFVQHVWHQLQCNSSQYKVSPTPFTKLEEKVNSNEISLQKKTI